MDRSLKCRTSVLFVIAALVAHGGLLQSAVAGTFEKIGKEVSGADETSADSSRRSGNSKQQSTVSSRGWDTDDSACDDDAGETVFGKLFFAGVTSPFWAPHQALSDDLSLAGCFPEHPYDEADGSLLPDKSPRGAHDSLIVLQGQYGDDFDRLIHANGRLLMEHSSRFGIDSEFFYRNEQLPNSHDELWTGDFNVTYRFAQSEHWQFRTGLGANWLTYRGDAESGINFTYGADWFPQDPWVFTGVIDWGRIGDAGLFHARTTAGVSHHGWGLFTGYDFFEIGDQEIHAWINGVELRF